MSIDIDNLEALAREASKGPWHVREMGDDFFVEGPGSPDMAFRLDVCGDDYTGHGGEEQRRHNMEHIAATDPDAILALIARLREAEAREQALALWREEVQSHVERDCIGTDQWNDELVELVAESYGMATSLARRDAEMRSEGAISALVQAAVEMRESNDRENVATVYALADHLEECARSIRRQAEQADTAGEES